MSDTSSTMKYRTLGRTRLRVSQIGLGGGGKSRLGQNTGNTEAESVQVVKRAIELGINLIDTSARNGTEAIIGQGIRGFDRDALVLSSKANVSVGDRLNTAAQFSASLESSLRILDTPYIDIMHFHGVMPEEYDYMLAELMPVMEKFRAEGKVRYIGITEHFNRDRDHKMLRRALADDFWDVIMVGFNMLNQSARKHLFSATQAKDIGVLGMFAVRRALTSTTAFYQALGELKSRGELSNDFDIENIREALCECEQPSASIADIAYRYCRDEPAVQSVLMGTGNINHLEQNIDTFSRPPLAENTRRFIVDNFGHISDFSGN